MNNRKIQDLQEEISQAAANYVADNQVVSLPFIGYECYLTTGNRLDFEKSYFSRRRQLTVLGLAYLLKKDQQVKQLLEQVIWEVCNEFTWALPAHLPVIGKTFAAASSTWLDLFAAETAQTLAELLELTDDAFSPLLQQRIKGEIDRRIFQSFENKAWDWEEKENNWSAVIGGSIGICALAILPKNSSQQKKIIQRLDKAMQSYLRGFGSDGVCVEGLGYCSYGFGYYIYYAEKLARMLGNYSYLDHKKVKKIAAFPYYVLVNKQDFVPFSDYSAVQPPSGLLNFCHHYFQLPIPKLATMNALDFDPCYRFAPLYRNLIWKKPTISNQQTKTIDHYFPDAQWWVVRKPNQLFFAAKGGSNDESHNHLDIGHFVFGTPSELFLTDLGAGEYTKDYFDEEKRYHIFPCSADSHSVPCINGTKQAVGNVSAKGVQANHQFSLQLAQAYPAGKIHSFERCFKLLETTLTIQDTFLFEQKQNRIIENFITNYLPKIVSNRVILTGKKAQCTLIMPTNNLTYISQVYKDHQGKDQVTYQIQATYQTKQQAKITTKLTVDLL
ncbi:heparinase II/III family protein [Melissococcus plutonius]|uniref:Heparinase II/III-like protein n=1 Tax=Melissococcus plutonius (strain ATCC 35311 / DSM 29964 / CIP 104052 / LMG 20360 / NCIMB 702443) TaxID=940190 RepID=F3Y8Q3_MELPT|nr:heparinase II/III family protein [Melissococcus plutonius]KMT30830.1 hypothetical protein MEPL6_6c03850 [Melissococcus plutonius]KMT35455.1 hypothetical protein MEPL8_2c01810 [Melissococcus plutonius]KMT41193.1 hypothetical protein MEPL12_1c03850 [Melissococcus plutonius]MBB5178050.1 hypothetical protein [Melissococcus plutonius]BAK20881.1 hypothetical protein MPTP_0399 [Melissococcus plutonius ATCC 35311]